MPEPRHRLTLPQHPRQSIGPAVAQVNPDLFPPSPAERSAGLFFCRRKGQAQPARRRLPAGRSQAHTVQMRTLVSLTVNGEQRTVDGPLTVAALLGGLGLDPRKVAIERNEEIVPRSAYAETWLAGGDSLEIVHFIGGG